MYHYVRDLEHSRYPGIKGLTVDDFRGQLDFLSTHYRFITVDELLVTLASPEKQITGHPVLLTFDDGYLDHFVNVFPVLDEKKIQGCFFPPAKPIQEHLVLDVNKIHFILAAADIQEIVRNLLSMLDSARDEYELESNDRYYQLYAHPSRFDIPDVAFVKTILQKILPQPCRKQITDALFRKFVASDEGAFSQDLYMSIDQIKCMQRSGMYIGSHGFSHLWMDTISEQEQQLEIEGSIKFLGELGCDPDSWSFNYPYGAYDNSTVSLLRGRSCRFGLTTKVGIADLSSENSLTLPRLDTNDLPKTKDAIPNQWTLDVINER